MAENQVCDFEDKLDDDKVKTEKNWEKNYEGSRKPDSHLKIFSK